MVMFIYWQLFYGNNNQCFIIILSINKDNMRIKKQEIEQESR